MANAPFPISEELIAVTLAYQNRSLVADRVFPRIPVGTQEFTYLKHSLAEGFTVPDTKVGRTSAPNKVEFSAAETASACKDYALDDVVPFADVQNAPRGYDPIASAVLGITNLIALDREVRAANAAFNAASYAAANKTTLSGTSQWSHASSDPVDAILAQFDALPMRPNRMVMGAAVWTKLRQHAKVVAAVSAAGGNAASGGVAAVNAVRELLELEDLIIGHSMVNSAKKGQTASLAKAWGKHALAFYSDPYAANTRAMHFGFTAQWGDRVAGQWEDRDAGMRGGMRVRVGESVVETIAAADVGFLWVDAVA